MSADQHLPAIIARLESLEERVATLEQLLADASALHKSRSLPLGGCAEGEALTAPARPEEGHRVAPGFVDAEELSSYPFLSTGERLQLFMRLFAHRRDRYAQRWVSKAGRTGYSPACDNKGKPSLCNLKAGCSNCVNRAYSTLDEKHVTNHLDPRVEQRHRETIGAYPLDSQNNTMFLAIDLDHGEWSPAAQALMASFAELSVSAYCERSRSGDGAHIWVFFQEPVSAKKARNLGTLALTHAMERSKAFSFSCYDRLFPNQDTLPARGFGNPIALPLQVGPRLEGNSLFVDARFEAYEDQWALLQHADTHRVSPQELEEILEAHGERGFLTMLRCAGAESLESGKQEPWKRVDESPLGKDDIPSELKVVRANKLFIPQATLSHRAEAVLARLAAFENPEYYRAQAMRRSVHKIPRVISCADSEGGYLVLPRGCEEELEAAAVGAGSVLEIVDETEEGRAIKVSFKGELLPEQVPAAEAMLAHDNGVLWAATAFGKTVLSAYLIAQRGVSTVILVHTTALVYQWQEKLMEFLEIDEPLPESKAGRGRKKKYLPVGVKVGGKDTRTGTIDVVCYKSIAQNPHPEEMLHGYGMLIVDECHHSAALTYEPAITASRARWVYGVSATPERADGHHPIAFMLCGPLRYKRTAKEQAACHEFEHVVLPRYTGFRRPISIEDEAWGPTSAQRCIAEDAVRSRLVVEDALASWREGRSPLILTERLNHAETLLEMIEEQCPNAYLLCGKATAKVKRERIEELRCAAENGPVIVVATGRYAGEGFDLPRLDTLCLAAPISGETPLSQYTGRLHRKYPGKKQVVVYDYVDFNEPLLEGMYHKRLRGYASLGYSVRNMSKDRAGAYGKEGRLYVGTALKADLFADIDGARSELVICSPQLHRSRFHQVLRACVAAQRRGVRVLVVTQTLDDYAPQKREAAAVLLQMLEESGVRHEERSQVLHRFMTVDGRFSWYGSVSVMGYWSKEDCVARFEDEGIVSMLHEGIRFQMG